MTFSRRDRLERRLAGQFPQGDYVKALEGETWTTGIHGSMEDERPAPSPWPYLEIETSLPGEVEQQLLGYPAYLFVRENGSYHERFLKVEVFVQVPWGMFDDHEDLWVYSERSVESHAAQYQKADSLPLRASRYRAWMPIKYPGHKVLVEQMEQQEIKPQSSEQYWQDQVRRQEQPGLRRDPQTGEPRGWDGD